MQSIIELSSSAKESLDLLRRPRRNRRTAAIRGLVEETRLHPSQLVAPLFLAEGSRRQEAISSMPGVYRHTIDYALNEIESLHRLGIRAVDLFPLVPKEKKDPLGTEAVQTGNLLHQAIRAIKHAFPELCIMVDIALDPYTDHGHDGVLDASGQVSNDATVKILAEMSIMAAEEGADLVAPSDMMDGRVAYIRQALDRKGFHEVGILSYAVKYASALYGPFREALQSAPRMGDKKGYQMNPANAREALLECTLDEWEGADMLMIKPALSYLDIIVKVRELTHLPLAAYQVSGEYAMIMAAAQNGWIDGDKVLMESLLSMKRAGADFIFTYGAKRAAELLQRP